MDVLTADTEPSMWTAVTTGKFLILWLAVTDGDSQVTYLSPNELALVNTDGRTYGGVYGRPLGSFSTWEWRAVPLLGASRSLGGVPEGHVSRARAVPTRSDRQHAGRL
jgi:hypothetical protein